MDQDKSCSRFRSCDQILGKEVFFEDCKAMNYILSFNFSIVRSLTFWFFLCSGLQKYLNQLGFNIVGYGCTTCIGNSGDIDETVSAAISENGNVPVY